MTFSIQQIITNYLKKLSEFVPYLWPFVDKKIVDSLFTLSFSLDSKD